MRFPLLFLKILIFLPTIVVNGQGNYFQLGFGMNQNVHYGKSYETDSILIVPGAMSDDLRPAFYVTFNKRFHDRWEFDAGISCSNIYHSYKVGSYNQTLGSYTEKVGVKKVTTFTFPVNIIFRVLGGLYLKGGLSASLGFSKNSTQANFNDTPEINDIYNSMQNTFKNHAFAFGFGCGYRLNRFDFVYYRREIVSKLTDPINVDGVEYDIFGRFHTNTLSIFYSLQLRSKNDPGNK